MTNNWRGAIFMMVSMASFTVNDAFMKLLSSEMELFQALFLRGIGTVAAFILVARWTGALRFDLGRRDAILVAVRSLAEVGSTYFFLTALFHMPLANVNAIFQALPLAITLAGALFLGLPVGWKRLTAIMVGFLGVLLIVQPGTDGFNTYSLYALASVGTVVVRDLATRQMSAAIPTATVALSAAVAVTLFSGIASAFIPWVMPSAMGMLQLFGALVFVLFGYVYSVRAMRTGDLGFVAPFRYSGLIWALGLGYLFFGQWPDLLILTGAAIIVATGVFTLLREARLAQKQRLAIRLAALSEP